MSVDSAYNCRRSIDAKLRVISGASEDDNRIFAPAISLAEEAIILGGIDQPAIVIGHDMTNESGKFGGSSYVGSSYVGSSKTGSASTAEPSLINYFNKIREGEELNNNCNNRIKMANKPNKSTIEPVSDTIEMDIPNKIGNQEDSENDDIGIVWADNDSVEGAEDITSDKMWSDNIQDE